jgi:hypothetical protein
MVKTPPVSPFVFEARDYLGRIIRITIPYDDVTKAINASATVHRDAGCLYTKIVVDVGGDGSPNSSTKKVTVPAGDTTVTVAQMSAVGLTSINQVINTQITAIP